MIFAYFVLLHKIGEHQLNKSTLQKVTHGKSHTAFVGALSEDFQVISSVKLPLVEKKKWAKITLKVEKCWSLSTHLIT